MLSDLSFTFYSELTPLEKAHILQIVGSVMFVSNLLLCSEGGHQSATKKNSVFCNCKSTVITNILGSKFEIFIPRMILKEILGALN